MTRLPLPYALSLASDAIAVPIGLAVCICLAVRMSFRAMGFPCINSTKPNTAQNILPLRHWLHMFRVNTVAATAQVINGETFWNRPNQKFVGVTMSRNPMSGIWAESPIATVIDSSSPQPAITAAVPIHFGPKALFGRDFASHAYIVSTAFHCVKRCCRSLGSVTATGVV